MNYYPIKPVKIAKGIEEGISSDAKLVVTSDAKYILRRVKDTKQAETEYKISKVLSIQNITSDILLSKRNQPFIEINDDIYNLQTYMPNQRGHNEFNYYDLGRIISIFHSETQKINSLSEQKDRFSLDEMWEQLKQNIGFTQVDFKKDLIRMVEQSFNYNHENNCYIHGDLGKWNLLRDENNIYIIDFGEVRKGNNHFDISAVISSTLDWNMEDEKIIASLNDFRNGYIANFEQFNWSILRENLTLWFTRGIIALLITNGINHHTCNTARLIIERRNRLDRIIKCIPAITEMDSLRI